MDHFAALLAAIRHPNDPPAVLLGPHTSGALREMATRQDDARSWHELNDFPPSAATILCGGPQRQLLTRPDHAAATLRLRRTGGTVAVSPEIVTAQRSKLRLVSSWATAPLDLLLGDPDLRVDHALRTRDADQRLSAQLRIRSFRSVVARDDVVLRDIMTELNARSACRGFQRRLAIVSEQDTPYGQFFEDIVRRVLDGMPECNIDVETFGYLRGLDGELPPGAPVRPYRNEWPAEGTGLEETNVWSLDDNRAREHAAGVARLGLCTALSRTHPAVRRGPARWC